MGLKTGFGWVRFRGRLGWVRFLEVTFRVVTTGMTPATWQINFFLTVT
jgi:hypothetical protein